MCNYIIAYSNKIIIFNERITIIRFVKQIVLFNISITISIYPPRIYVLIHIKLKIILRTFKEWPFCMYIY